VKDDKVDEASSENKALDDASEKVNDDQLQASDQIDE